MSGEKGIPRASTPDVKAVGSRYYGMVEAEADLEGIAIAKRSHEMLAAVKATRALWYFDEADTSSAGVPGACRVPLVGPGRWKFFS